MVKLLLVADDPLLLTSLSQACRNQGYAVGTTTADWKSLDLARPQDYDLILLDTHLAQPDGISLCRQLRAQGNQTPILLLIEATESSGIVGLDAGADDYVVKPYHLPELFARVRTLLRRKVMMTPTLLCWEALCLNSAAAEVTYKGQPLSLTPKEFRLLELFLNHPQRIFSRTAIVDRLWAFDVLPHESTVTNHIKELRQKLKAVGMTVDIIETVYGLGYRLKSPPKPRLAEAHLSAEGTQLIDAELPASENPAEVLVVVEDAAILAALSYLLQPWGLRVTGLSDPTQLWQTLNTAVPDLLILDLELTNFSGVDLCRQVRQDAKWGDLPILVITAYTNAESIQWAFAAGADDFVGKPIVGPELVTRVVSRLEQQQPQQQKRKAPPLPRFKEGTHQTASELSEGRVWDTYGNILLVDDQPENLRTLSKILSRQGYKVRKALSGAVALDAIRSQPPDLVILDVRMPEMNGYEVCAILKAQPPTREIPILFLSALDDTEDKLKAFAVGGADYITKPFREEEVLARIKHQLIIVQQQRQLIEQTRQLQREIQERHQSEATLYQLQTALKERETQFQILFHQAPIALGLMGLNDRWLEVNLVLCRLLGYTEAELLAVPISDCVQDQDDRNIPFAQLLNNTDQTQIKAHCRSKSHSLTLVWIHLSIWQTVEGSPVSYLAQFQAVAAQDEVRNP